MTLEELVKRLREYNGNAPLLWIAAATLEEQQKMIHIASLSGLSETILVRKLNSM
jgi:hypothetical protein